MTARIADVASTLWCTPNFLLEGNPLIRRYGKTFLYLTILGGLIPLIDLNTGIAITTGSFLAAFSNLSKATIYRFLGEAETSRLIQSHRQRLGKTKWLIFSSVPLIVPVLFGLMIVYGSRNDGIASSYYIGMGAVAFSFAVFIHRCFAK
jgi:hypothetical protein